MEDVDSVEIYLPAREHGVRAGVMPERPVVIRQLQHDCVRRRRHCGGRDLLEVDSLFGQQTADDLAERVVADAPADVGRHSGCSEGKAGIRNASAEGELRRANLIELAWHQLGNTAELRSDVDAQRPGDKY